MQVARLWAGDYTVVERHGPTIRVPHLRLRRWYWVVLGRDKPDESPIDTNGVLLMESICLSEGLLGCIGDVGALYQSGRSIGFL